ncbi:MAG: hypothetical protein ACE5ES_01345 [Candidatus Nanoarchaeia archaeon]
MQLKRGLQRKKIYSKRITASNQFVTMLAIVSIIGFLGIISNTLFDFNFEFYVEALLMFTIGVGLILEGKVSTFTKVRSEGLTPVNFTHLVTVIIGIVAALAGIFSLPQIRIETNGFLAIKGIVSVIAIIVIIIQTWIVE